MVMEEKIIPVLRQLFADALPDSAACTGDKSEFVILCFHLSVQKKKGSACIGKSPDTLNFQTLLYDFGTTLQTVILSSSISS